MTRHRTADLEPTDFGGRYTLLRRLAVGGMAEIYLARQAGMAGFDKQVVIKRLRAELADDPRVVEMFLDEARIGAQLNHANVVHVYDVDEHDGIPYIAMEFIVGEELNEVCRQSITLDKFLPLEHAVELVRQAAAGMGYFHAKRGTEGTPLENEPLGIVHLDISPSNLLVTRDGFLKIIDFGIARAKGQTHRTDVLPGKLSYMSPEQAARRDIDHRSDIFSLGIVLYEITVGRRLFRGPAAEVVHRLIEARVEPPTFSRRNFPPALEAIVMRALEKYPDDRYQNAYDLADDLESFLRDEKLHSGPVRIARYLDLLVHASGGVRRPELLSEAEGGRAADLDFDSRVFDSFVPGEGAPGPAQAPLWEDVEQNDADVAAALKMELAELRVLRTPVPTRPSGVEVVVAPRDTLPDDMRPAGEAGDGAGSGSGSGSGSDADSDDDEDAPATRPVPRMRTAEIYGDQEDVGPRTSDLEPQNLEPQNLEPQNLEPQTTALKPGTGVGPSPLAEVRGPRSEVPVQRDPTLRAPTIGAALLARQSSRVPWALLIAVVVAVAAVVAYIVVK